jgi:SAM-dependent MidA family methyltransferase
MASEFLTEVLVEQLVGELLAHVVAVLEDGLLLVTQQVVCEAGPGARAPQTAWY